MILASGLCVDANVTAALSTPDTVNELFQAQMQCFLTIWSTLHCRVFQTRKDGKELRNAEPRAGKTCLEESCPPNCPSLPDPPGIMFHWPVIHLFNQQPHIVMGHLPGGRYYIRHWGYKGEYNFALGLEKLRLSKVCATYTQ